MSLLNPPLVDWCNQVVWLVGTPGPLSRRLAQRLHGLGARLVLSGREAKLLHEFTGWHPGSLALALDVTQAAALQAGCTRIVRDHGRLDVMIHCADALPQVPASEAMRDMPAGRRELSASDAAQILIDAVRPLLLRQGRGHLALMLEPHDRHGQRSALRQQAERLRPELAQHGVGVSLIDPGQGELPAPEEAIEDLLQGLAAGRAEIALEPGMTGWMRRLWERPGRACSSLLQRSGSL